MRSGNNKVRFAARVGAAGVAACLLGTSAASAGPGGCNSGGRANDIGININNLHYPMVTSPNLMSALKKSGAGWVRMNLFWAWTELSPGQFNWRGVDTVFAQLQAAHIEPLVVLYGPVPCWALGSSAGKCTTPRWTSPPPALWANFVKTAVTKFSGSVHYWEIWNEPDHIQNIDTPDQHQRLTDYRDNILIPGAQAVHAADPSAKVVAPGFVASPSAGDPPGPALQNAVTVVLGGAAARSVDVVSVHVYLPIHPADAAGSVRQAMNSLGMNSKPLWLTEIGVAPYRINVLGNYQAAQADLINGEMTQLLHNGTVDKAFWYALTDDMSPTGGHRDTLGIIDNADYSTFAWTPRPGFAAFQALTSGECSR